MTDQAGLRPRIWGPLVLVLLAALAFALDPVALAYKQDAATTIPSLFGYLVLVSMVVERATEIFLSAWRSTEADHMDQKLASLKTSLADAKAAGTDPTSLNSQLEQAQTERTSYRARSRRIAQWIGLIIGSLVSLAGVRILGNLVSAAALPHWQQQLFVMVDVLLTGTVLAGGSDAVNKLMKVYSNAMSSTADKLKS
ncbi:hypothetical protein PVT67_12165 [Gallaecimonas kandeliae]|uniref:hypothetical protein n=1 Tax=Gallaecimonas kandeliae TaxID=3029055 RepID=UPI0026478342|nr:hypothetical protein [Gallaecimonas kandeliae]WKE64430.1 hypothetical protein PVT67_12165 [Gallaecimonas kandeliae]